jgi:hypothetical protein
VLDATALSGADRAAPSAAARRELAAAAPELADAVELVAAVNKIDLVALPAAPSSEAVFTSALTGAGLDALIAAIVRRLVPEPPAAGAAVPFLSRHVDLLAAAVEALPHDPAGAVAILDSLVNGNAGDGAPPS